MSAKSIVVSAIICATVVGASGYFVLQSERNVAKEISTRSARWDAEKAELEEALSKAQSGIVVAAPSDQENVSDLDPLLLVQRLSNLNEDNRKKVREALYCFQGLVEAGTRSIPPIRDYFTGGENVLLNGRAGQPADAMGPGGGPGQGRNGMREMMGNWMGRNRGGNSIVPASTRLGLMDVLKDIGGDDAIALLGQIVPTALNASELVYLSSILQGIDSSAFVSVTLTTARNLLADSGVSNGDKRQLYELLAQLGDTEYAASLLDSLYVDGNLDMSTLDFLVNTLGEGAMNSIYNAFNDPNASQQTQGALMMRAMNFVGSNAQATEMFNTSFNAVGNNQMLKNMMMLGLAGVGPGSEGMTPENAINRLSVLNTYEQQYGNDPAMANVLSAARTQLEYRSNPGAYSEAPQIDFRQLMGGGDRGNRGGGMGRGPGGGR